MSSIDNRVVSMTFDNRAFESNLADTLDSLEELSRSLQMVGAIEGLSGIGEAVDDINLSNIESALDNISNKFSVLGAIGFAAIQKLTHAAMDFASNITQKALGPLLGGGKLRAENIEQAKFLFRGLGMDVEDSMQSALDAVKGTAYGLDVAAKTAAQFGGSGMKAGKEMTGALRAVAGVAAMTNTSYEEMADVFTSAAGKGKVSGYELQRIGQRGLNAAAALGKVWGKTEQEVRKMATDGEISFKMFAEGMDEAFGEHATKANETYTGSLANMRAALSRMGASFFGPHMLQQRDLFNALTPAIDSAHDALKPLIATFVEIKGIGIANLIKTINSIDFGNFTYAATLVSNGLRHAFANFQQILGVIKEAFREIFPKSSTSLLLTVAALFERITERMKASEKTVQQIKSVFRGIFAALAIGIEVIRVVANLFRDLFETFVSPDISGGGKIMGFFANFGESIVRLKEALVDGGGIQEAVGNIVLWFMRLGDYIRYPGELIDTLRAKLSGLFGGAGGRGGIPGAEGAMTLLDRVRERLGMLSSAVEGVGNAWGWLSDRFAGIRRALSTVWGWVSNWFKELKDKLAAVFTPADFDPIVDAVNVGLLGGIALLLRNFMKNGLSFDFGGGMIESIKGMFEGLTETLSAMQTELKARTLKQIAIAIAVLTASILVLSLIDSVALTKALIAISVGLGQLMTTMWALEKLSIGPGMTQVAANLILISVAVLILSAAVRSFSGLGWEELAKGLVGIAGGLAVLVVGMNALQGGQAGIVRAGIAMGIIAASLYILSISVKAFARMDWGEMFKGLVGVYAGLIAIGTAMKFMPEKRMMAQGVALILIATALRILANAVQAFGDIELGELAKGLVGAGAGLVVIAGAMHLMPKGMVLQGAGLILVATGLRILASAVAAIGSIPFGELAKGIGAMAVTLTILAVALNLMVGTMGGAAAVLVASVALHSMFKVIQNFGRIDLTELAIGLGAIAAVFITLGLSALVLAPVVPVLFSLGVAIALIGGGFAAFGLGAMLLAKSFEVIAKVGKTAAKVFVETAKIVVGALPEILSALAMAVIKMGLTLIEAAPVILKALTVLLVHVLETIREVIPEFVKTVAAIVIAILDYFQTVLPKMVETGFKFLMAILRGIRDNIGEIVIVVSEIITNFIDALTKKIPELVDSVYAFFMTAITELAKKIGENMTAFVPVGKAVIDGFLLGLEKNLPGITDWFKALPRMILDIVKTLLGIKSPSTVFSDIGVDIILGLLQGLGKKIADVATWFRDLPGKILGWVGGLLDILVEKGKDVIRGFFNGILERYRAVRDWFKNLGTFIKRGIGDTLSMLVNVGRDLVIGFLNGIADNWHLVTSWLGAAARALPSWIKAPLGIRSPSRVFMKIGEQIIQGLTVAFDKDRSMERSVDGFAGDMITAMQEALGSIPDILGDMDELNPTITPVLDLSQIKSSAKDLDRMIDTSKVAPRVSYVRASDISSATATSPVETEEIVQAQPAEVRFEQNIYAPEPLSTNDIYRATRSQITLAKEKLGVR